MLGPQDLKAVLLREIPDATTRSHDSCGKFLGDNVEKEVQTPVEHLDEEREFAQDPRMDVIRELSGARCVDGCDATA